jgi:DNA-binding MarR family transcriptional regulator
LRLGLTSGSVTALLDRLGKAGFVSRSQHPDDRRSLLATATPAGRHAMQWFYEELDAIVAQAIAAFPDLPLPSLSTVVVSVGESLIEHVREGKENG